MIGRIEIENFRIFKKLIIEPIRQVNLIAGKNNTGKTTLLEAIRILAAKGESSVVNHILSQRGQFRTPYPSNYESLFNTFNPPMINTARINEIYIHSDPKLKDEQDTLFHIKKGKASTSAKINTLDHRAPTNFPRDTVVFVPFFSQGSNLFDLWKKIALTELEDELFNIIRETVEPRLIRLNIDQEGVFVRLEKVPKPIPVQVLGEGVQRVLLLALALVNAQGKILLVDEFESGIHHSVQEKLWELTFHFATNWNIQVFATTHSQDAIQTFFQVGSREKYRDTGGFIRLQRTRRDETIEAATLDMSQLETALEVNLEIR